MQTSLSVVVPAYNEGTRLSSGLTRLMDHVCADDTEIIVVDDGSSDGTPELARRILDGWPRASVLTLSRNSGKGAAVKAGVAAARGASIAFMDADMATDLGDLEGLLGALDDNHVAVGCRSHQDSVVGRRGAHREVMNRAFGMLVASMTLLPYTDTQCGFKAFRGPVAKLLFHGVRTQRFAFDVEVLDLAARMGLRTVEVPVRWNDVSGSKVRPAHDSLQMLRDVTCLRLNRRPRPTVHGILLPDLSVEAALPVVESKVRAVDLVVGWGRGTAVLFPCLSASESLVASARLLSVFEDLGAQPLGATFRDLYSPTLAADVRGRVLET